MPSPRQQAAANSAAAAAKPLSHDLPFLVAKTPRGSAHALQGGNPYSVLALWHLLSLDAPTVAATWTLFIAWASGVPMPWRDAAAMFVAVWMLYAADRLLDAKPLFTAPSAVDLEQRHHFHHTHRRAFLLGILIAALPLLALLHLADAAVLHLYTLLTGLLAVWLLIVHARPAPSAASHRLPKELAVGLFFPAAVWIPTVARVPSLRLALLPPALFFALLCSLNCLFLYAWEHPRGRGKAHATTRWAVRHLKALALTATLLSDAAYLAVSTIPRSASPALWLQLPHAAAPLLACSLSGTFYLVLHARRRHLTPLTLRALADLVLLTPIPIMLITALVHLPR